MAAGDLISAPWQVELGGLLMGDGTGFVIRRFQPWQAPQLRTGDTGRVAAHGLRGQREWLGGRKVTLDLYVTGVDDADETANRQALIAAWMPAASEATVPLVWMEDTGVLYRLHGRPRQADARVDPRIPTECRFLALDPRIYSNILHSASTPLAAATGGLTFPASAPFVFGTSGTTAVMDCANDGLFPAPWTATFTGPLTAPELVHIESGARLSMSGAVLDPGQTLVIDSDLHTVMLDGTASRFSWLDSTSQWFELDPGPNSVQLLGSAGSGGVTISWRHAWI